MKKKAGYGPFCLAVSEYLADWKMNDPKHPAMEYAQSDPVNLVHCFCYCQRAW